MQQPIFPAPSIECCFSHPQVLLSLCQGYFPGFPILYDLLKVVRNRKNRPAKMNTTRSRRRNAFGLALFYILPFRLRDKAGNLEHQVCNECTHEVFAVPGIQ